MRLSEEVLLEAEYCVKIVQILKTVVSSQVLSLDTVDDESEINPRFTAYDVSRDLSVPCGSIVDQQFRRLRWFLMVPGQGGFLISTIEKNLTGLAADGDLLPC